MIYSTLLKGTKMDENVVSIKVHLRDENERELEVRRFGIIDFQETNFKYLSEKIVEVFPRLKGKLFTLHWKDEDDDEIMISCDEDLLIGLNEMKSKVKKFYVKIREAGPSVEGSNTKWLHPMVYCDECNDQIMGFRYKCIACRNYDLCSGCEQASVHSEHPMLRIPNPFIFSCTDLQKIIRGFLTFAPIKVEGGKHHSHHRRRHSHDNTNPDFCKKKRKCDKHESNPESEESDENGSRKHSHGKSKKMNRCVYTQLMNEFFTFFDPAQLQTGGATKAEETKKPKAPEEKPEEEVHHAKYLKSVGKTLTSLLDSLGIDVDFEIREKEDKKAEPEQKIKNEKETSASSGASTSQQKEVRFATPEKETEIDELARVLSNQKVSESPEKEDWVSFEELKQDSNDNDSKNATAATKEPQLKRTVSASAPPQETQNLYPNINSRVPTNPVIREALDKMLSMGFSNDGDWLTHLLEAKKGDIDQALEVLAPHKNK